MRAEAKEVLARRPRRNADFILGNLGRASLTVQEIKGTKFTTPGRRGNNRTEGRDEKSTVEEKKKNDVEELRTSILEKAQAGTGSSREIIQKALCQTR
jgi:hypothetical protein